jgi:DNA mismatch repair protein MutH
MAVIVCRVLSPIIAPIVARPGELLVIRPAAHDSLAVTDATGTTELRRAAIPPGRLYGDLLHLMLDDAIRPLTSADERLLLAS